MSTYADWYGKGVFDGLGRSVDTGAFSLGFLPRHAHQALMGDETALAYSRGYRAGCEAAQRVRRRREEARLRVAFRLSTYRGGLFDPTPRSVFDLLKSAC